MRLILTEYLRTLRERDEFDLLLPDLAVLMGYVPVAKPQIGPRQYGVDFAAVKEANASGPGEMLLFCIKQGDLGRRDWDSDSPTCVRSSLNEILDVYLPKYVSPEHAQFKKTIVLATTGELKQDTELSWSSFQGLNQAKASFEFWGGYKVASLLEEHMLDEHIFVAEDRAALRRALSLAGDSDYDFRDLHQLILRQLGLGATGELVGEPAKVPALLKALRRVHLAAQMCVVWAQQDGDTRQAIFVYERTLLWSWHRILLAQAGDRHKLFGVLEQMRLSYMQSGKSYMDTLWPYLSLRDGIVGYTRESAQSALVLFEHMGILATLGLAYVLDDDNESEDSAVAETLRKSAQEIGDALCDLIKNNTASASPRLDRHSIDISLAIVLLLRLGRLGTLQPWVEQLAIRLDFTFGMRSKFPISTDSIDDLVESGLHPANREAQEELMRASWTTAVVAAASALLGRDDVCELLQEGIEQRYPMVVPQHWHPTEGWEGYWYFGQALGKGTSEAPASVPKTGSELRDRIAKFLDVGAYEWSDKSTARAAGMWFLDLIACRHHHSPVPPSFLYRCFPAETQLAASHGPVGQAG